MSVLQKVIAVMNNLCTMKFQRIFKCLPLQFEKKINSLEVLHQIIQGTLLFCSGFPTMSGETLINDFWPGEMVSLEKHPVTYFAC